MTTGLPVQAKCAQITSDSLSLVPAGTREGHTAAPRCGCRINAAWSRSVVRRRQSLSAEPSQLSAYGSSRAATEPSRASSTERFVCSSWAEFFIRQPPIKAEAGKTRSTSAFPAGRSIATSESSQSMPPTAASRSKGCPRPRLAAARVTPDAQCEAAITLRLLVARSEPRALCRTPSERAHPGRATDARRDYVRSPLGNPIAPRYARPMPGRDEGMRARSAGKVCPWCNTASTYENETGTEFLKSLPRVAKGLVGMVLTPVKSAGALFGPLGMSLVCANCRNEVHICPKCDTPNRDLGAIDTCSSCGTTFVC
jgi:hypothetical protein